MKLKRGRHLAYCTNIHRGESWDEIFSNLQQHTLRVRDQVAPGRPYAIGLRLSWQAARQLKDSQTLADFQRWLDRENCYVFTINGFPYGTFHGARVKEHVYAPDWTQSQRVDYTVLLFELLAALAPDDVDGSVSTVPCSFKEFIHSEDQARAMRSNLWRMVEAIAALSKRTGKELHLGLEPEPLCYLETSEETVRFFGQLQQDRPGDDRWQAHLGVNYDACHLAVEFEDPLAALRRFREHQIKISKLHLSSALKVTPTLEARRKLKAFVDPVYFHQVIARSHSGDLQRHRDLDAALGLAEDEIARAAEWRIHFHVPLHWQGNAIFGTTRGDLLRLMDALGEAQITRHLEMETYTWEVLPPELKDRNVVDQLVAEYRWTLSELSKRGLAEPLAGNLC